MSLELVYYLEFEGVNNDGKVFLMMEDLIMKLSCTLGLSPQEDWTSKSANGRDLIKQGIIDNSIVSGRNYDILASIIAHLLMA